MSNQLSNAKGGGGVWASFGETTLHAVDTVGATTLERRM